LQRQWSFSALVEWPLAHKGGKVRLKDRRPMAAPRLRGEAEVGRAVDRMAWAG